MPQINDYISLVGESHTTFDAQQLRRMRSPCVYAFMRGDEVLYIGMSKSGVSRPLAIAHKQIPTNDALQATDSVRVWYFSSKEKAIAAERELIFKLQPILNTAGKDSLVTSKTVHCINCNKNLPDYRRRFCSKKCSRIYKNKIPPLWLKFGQGQSLA